MDIFSIDKLLLFIIFFVPGFVSIKVYDLFIANEPRDFSRSLFEAIAYSAINFALLGWLIWTIHVNEVYFRHPIVFAVLSIFILFVAPILWPILYLWLLKWKWLSNYIIGPVKRPWDWFFNQKLPVWVIVTLVDGRKIGGVYADKSYASSYPLPEQIYLEQIWTLDEKGRFVEVIKGSKGVIILNKDMSTIEFFTDEVHDV